MEEKWDIKVLPKEYVEIHLATECVLREKKRVFDLHDETFLTCFMHPSDRHYLLYDCEQQDSLLAYLKGKKVSKGQLQQWIREMVEAFERCPMDVCLFQIRYIFVNLESGHLKFIRIPVTLLQTEVDVAFGISEIFEYIDFVDDQQWLSSLYLLCKQRPFRLSMLDRFLNERVEKQRFSFFFWRKKQKEDTFFHAFEVHEQYNQYQPLEDRTTWMGDGESFKTQILMDGSQYGYFLDEMNQQQLISVTPFVIGRQSDCTLCLNYPEISKHHAQLVVETGQCFIMDLGSTNGTFVNGVRLTKAQRTTLKENDEVSIAGHLLIYHA